MINRINPMGGFMSQMQVGAMKQQPDPAGVFTAADQDGSGGVSQSELETLAAGIQEITGTTIDTQDAMSTYDADEDGALSGEELAGVMTEAGLGPPPPMQPAMMTTNGQGGQTGTGPPPPPPMNEAISAYTESSSFDQITQLIDYLNAQTTTEEAVNSMAYMSLNIVT